ncbi:hypothetical protein [Mucilaginibacter ginsenosidivorans]|uniref:Uncharacterized protein n=1 Tax=Mucilaginibacter ginsenosidivorans TaxID=398053 RepID=A0A5B8UWR3_9SPHI|nr:hypothetical protein [Mucilaginibacter ginsenosidivorans]QEC63338.1 hypothetical protein FRZ54_12385 [Mucilaginibacter ginsenosidivorans]
MKKNLFVTLLLFTPLFSFAQTFKPIDGAIGIKFGDEGLKAKNIITAHGGEFDILGSHYPESLHFTHVNFGHFASELAAVKLFRGKVYEMGFIFRVDTGAKTISYYNDLVASLNKIYGEGKSTWDFKSPYTKGDGNEVEAIKTGNADVETLWIDKTNAIQVKIVPDAYVIMLTFQDSKVAEQANAKK